MPRGKFLTKLQRFNPPWTGAYLELPFREARAAVTDLSAEQLANGDKVADMWADFLIHVFWKNQKRKTSSCLSRREWSVVDRLSIAKSSYLHSCLTKIDGLTCSVLSIQYSESVARRGRQIRPR
jgi:hypothetical protein